MSTCSRACTAKKLVPSTVLDRAGTTFLTGILLTVKHRLEHQLERDYRHWATTQSSTKVPTILSATGSPP